MAALQFSEQAGPAYVGFRRITVNSYKTAVTGQFGELTSAGMGKFELVTCTQSLVCQVSG